MTLCCASLFSGPNVRSWDFLRDTEYPVTHVDNYDADIGAGWQRLLRGGLAVLSHMLDQEVMLLGGDMVSAGRDMI